MLKRAFSYIETIISVFICLIVLIPTIKINLKQIYTYKIVNKYEQNLMFFDSIKNHLKAENFFYEKHENLSFKNYEELISNNLFKNFSSFNKNKKFDLILNIKVLHIDFYLRNYSINIIKINFEDNNIKLSDEIIKFKNEE